MKYFQVKKYAQNENEPTQPALTSEQTTPQRRSTRTPFQSRDEQQQEKLIVSNAATQPSTNIDESHQIVSKYLYSGSTYAYQIPHISHFAQALRSNINLIDDYGREIKTDKNILDVLLELDTRGGYRHFMDILYAYKEARYLEYAQKATEYDPCAIFLFDENMPIWFAYAKKCIENWPYKISYLQNSEYYQQLAEIAFNINSHVYKNLTLEMRSNPQFIEKLIHEKEVYLYLYIPYKLLNADQIQSIKQNLIYAFKLASEKDSDPLNLPVLLKIVKTVILEKQYDINLLNDIAFACPQIVGISDFSSHISSLREDTALHLINISNTDSLASRKTLSSIFSNYDINFLYGNIDLILSLNVFKKQDANAFALAVNLLRRQDETTNYQYAIKKIIENQPASVKHLSDHYPNRLQIIAERLKEHPEESHVWPNENLRYEPLISLALMDAQKKDRTPETDTQDNLAYFPKNVGMQAQKSTKLQQQKQIAKEKTENEVAALQRQIELTKQVMQTADTAEKPQINRAISKLQNQLNDAKKRLSQLKETQQLDTLLEQEDTTKKFILKIQDWPSGSGQNFIKKQDEIVVLLYWSEELLQKFAEDDLLRIFIRSPLRYEHFVDITRPIGWALINPHHDKNTWIINQIQSDIFANFKSKYAEVKGRVETAFRNKNGYLNTLRKPKYRDLLALLGTAILEDFDVNLPDLSVFDYEKKLNYSVPLDEEKTARNIEEFLNSQTEYLESQRENLMRANIYYMYSDMIKDNIDLQDLNLLQMDNIANKLNWIMSRWPNLVFHNVWKQAKAAGIKNLYMNTSQTVDSQMSEGGKNQYYEILPESLGFDKVDADLRGRNERFWYRQANTHGWYKNIGIRGF